MRTAINGQRVPVFQPPRERLDDALRAAARGETFDAEVGNPHLTFCHVEHCVSDFVNDRLPDQTVARRLTAFE